MDQEGYKLQDQDSWLNIPEVARAQDPIALAEWTTSVDQNVQRLRDDPQLHDEPWSDANLASAERSLLNAASDMTAVDPSVITLYAQYLGHGLTSILSGTWLRVPKEIAGRDQYGVSFINPSGLILVEALVSEAIERRSGDVWVEEYGRSRAAWGHQ